MPTAVPFTLAASIDFSPDGVAPTCPRSRSITGAWDEKDDDQHNLTGSGSVVVTLKGPAKALYITVDASSTAAPLNIRINGGTDDIEISPGGLMVLSNPNPSVGITSVTIVHTTANVVTLVALS